MRDGFEQFAGVSVPGAIKDFLGFTILDDFPLIHHSDVIRNVADHREVVGDEDHGEAEFSAQLAQQVEDLGLDGDVEGGDRFVGDDQFRLRGEGAGDGDPLALAAGKLVGVFAQVARVEADGLHELGDALVSASPESLRWRWRTASARVEKTVIRGLSEA